MQQLDTIFSRESEILMGVAFTFMSFTGTFGNLLTIMVMIKFRRLHNFCTPFLINLSICDAMMTALILPILGLNGITGYSYLPTILCKIVSIIFHVIIAVASCSLAAVSFIRCLAIWTDNKCRLLERHKTCLAFIWTIPAIALFAFYNSNWSDERHIRSSYVCSFFCGMNSMRQYRNQMHKNPQALMNKSYIHNVTITDMEDYLDEDNYNKTNVPGWLFIIPPTLFHFIPLCILVVCYCMIWVKIKRSNDGIEGMVAFNKHKNEVRFSQMIGMIFGSYLFCSTLPTMVAAFGAISRIQENATDTRVFSSEFLPIGLPSVSQQSSELNVLSNNGSILPMPMKPNRERPNAAPMLTFTYIIFFLQNLCNPLIYIVSNRAYRTAYYKILWRKSHSPPDGTTLYRSSQHRDAFEMNTQYA